MTLPDSSIFGIDHPRPLYVSIEIVANLAYLAKHSPEDPAQVRKYLDKICEVLSEMRHHPNLA